MPDLTRVRPETGQLTPFDFDGTPVRVLTDEHGEPWFVAADVTSLLGYGGGARNAITRLPGRMKGVAPVNTLGGAQEMTTVNEAGVNRLIMRSNLPSAEAVQDWLAEDVLPQIRRTGAYGVADIATLPATDILAIAQRLVVAEARAAESEAVVDAIEASNGITITEFHKHYFSDVPARVFFERLYALELLIDQRGARGRDEKGRLKAGKQHRHPAAKGKPFFYLHGAIDNEGVRRESVRVRPGRPETDLVQHLASKGLTPNPNALTASTTPKEIAA